jgi:RecB family endonuclease NucS
MIAAIAGLTWTARKLSISTLDAQALTSKLAVPDPASAMDWPELRVRAVIPQPDEPSLVMVDVVWPEHPRRTATLLVALNHEDANAIRLLVDWCDGQARVAPMRCYGQTVELRRRQTRERVRGDLIAEDITLAS